MLIIKPLWVLVTEKNGIVHMAQCLQVLMINNLDVGIMTEFRNYLVPVSKEKN